MWKPVAVSIVRYTFLFFFSFCILVESMSAQTVQVDPRTKVSVYSESDLSSLYVLAAQEVISTVRTNPFAVILLPTGVTPEKMYAAIVALFKNDPKVDFSKVQFFNLDEYLGLEPNHPLSYRYYMDYHFYGPLAQANPKRAPLRGNQHFPLVDSSISPDRVALDYDRMIEEASLKAGGIDLAILGVGGAYPVKMSDGQVILRGGHLAFNEPGVKADQPTHAARLTEKTKLDTLHRFKSLKFLIRTGEIAGNFTTQVPDFAITIGMRRILSAKKILVLATGENKGPVIDHVFNSKPSGDFPASLLRDHSDVHWVLDEFAAHSLTFLPKPNLHSPQQLASLLKEKSDRSALPEGRKILILSPHPDDDVISMGATIVRLLERKNVLRIVYAVSGSNSVRKTEPQYLDYLEKQSLAHWDPIADEKAKALVRKSEATQATSRLGVDPNCLVFLEAEYYQRRGVPGISPLPESDISALAALLRDFAPEHIFFAAENDPNGAHGLSTQLLAEAFSRVKKENPSQFSDTRFYGYRGAYNEWDLRDPESLMVVPFSEEVFQLKMESIRDHASQLDPLFPDFDPRPFYQRAGERNRSTGESLHLKIGTPASLCTEPFAEAFRIWTAESFTKSLLDRYR